MRRAVLTLAVALGMLALTPAPSWACSCAFLPSAVAEHVHRAGTVAVGTVGWTATDGQSRTYKVDFERVYKGAAATSEKLLTAAEGSACGLGSLAPGRRYLFFISGEHPGAMRIDSCGGTTAYDAALAAQVEAITGPSRPPIAEPGVADTGASGHITRNVMLGAGAALLAMIAATSLAGRRRGAGTARRS